MKFGRSRPWILFTIIPVVCIDFCERVNSFRETTVPQNIYIFQILTDSEIIESRRSIDDQLSVKEDRKACKAKFVPPSLSLPLSLEIGNFRSISVPVIWFPDDVEHRSLKGCLSCQSYIISIFYRSISSCLYLFSFFSRNVFAEKNIEWDLNSDRLSKWRARLPPPIIPILDR